MLLLVYLFGFQFQASAQTNIYTMPPTEVRGASGRVFILNGAVSSVHLVDGGKGYTTPPNVAIVLTNGTGSGAVVTATVANGSVTGLSLQNTGGYSSPASGIVVIDLPPNPLQAVIQSNLYGTIILPAGTFEMNTVVSNNVTIRGQGMGLTTVSGGGRGSAFRVTPGKTVAFENMSITRGSATNGGGIYNDAGLVTVQGCRISDNEATGAAGEGGGIYNRGSAVLIVTNSVVSNNTSKRNGGGISNSGLNTAVLPPLAGTLQNLPNTLRGFYSDLQDNVRYGINYTADYFGNLVANPPDFSKIIRNALSSLNSADFGNLGKIDTKLQEYLGKSQDDSTAPLDNSLTNVVRANGPGTITNAMADPYSSGVGGTTGWVDMAAPVLLILNSTISDNRVATAFSGFGGGIHNDLGLVFVDNSTIENNLADSNLGTFGGGINSIFGAIRIQNSRINNNTARSKTIFAAGGAVLSFAGFLDVHDSEFVNNQVDAKFLSSGGAIKHTAGARGTIDNTRIIGNRSGGGGGIANDYLAKLTINRVTLESNSVSGVISANGGGIRNDMGGELEISNSTFSFNVATDRCKGGGLYNHCEEMLDLAEQAVISESKVSLVNCTFSSNRVDGTYFKIPHPSSLASCLLAQQYPPYTPCNFNSLPTIDIPLTSRGGAIYNGAEGGGEAELTLSACTINGNAATGPLYVAGGVYCTGAAGLNPTNIGVAFFKFANSIVARNTGLDFSKDVLPSPISVQSQGGNLDSDGTLYSASIGGITTAANPGLGPLRNNGGPTRTHALLTGSPAINTGSAGNCTATDQRGVIRSMGGACDIGAVEKVNPFGFADSYVALQEQPLVVNATSSVLSNDFADAATVQLVSSVSNGTLSLSADGSFTYTGNTNFFGTNTFTYRLVDGGFQSAPIQVTIIVRPVLKIVSTSPVTNRVDAPLNSDVAMGFNNSLNAGTVPGSIKVRGAQSRVPNSVPVAGGTTVTVNPPVDFRPGEAVTVSVLKSLKASNGAELLKPAQWQFTADALRGDGVFKPGPAFGSYGSEGAVVGDFDGDGDLDIFVAKRSNGDQVWRNDGNGNFPMVQSFRDNSSGAAVGDVDGDGDLDIVVSKWGGFDDVVPAVTVEYHTVLRNNGLGTFAETGQKIIPDTFRDALSPNIPEPFRYTALMGATAVKLADLNGDGSLDILFLGGLSDAFYLYRTPGNYVWLNNGSGYFEPTGQVFGDSITYDAALGDLDGDGDIDVFTANGYSSGINVPSQVWLNDSGGHFSLGYQTDGFWGRAVALGDLDRDGDLDAVVCGAAPDPVLGLVNRTRVLTNNGLANFAASQFVGASTTESVAIADVNADGHLDLLLSQGFSTRPWTNNGSGIFTWNGTSMPNQRATELCPGDFDGDGDVDLLIANARQPGDSTTPNEGVQNQIWYNNNSPVATNDVFTIAEDGFLSAPSVLTNDSDADGDPLVAETTTTIVHRGTLGQLIGQFGAAHNYPYEGTWPSGSYVYNEIVPLFSTNGTLNFLSDGTFTYRPNTNFAGTDIFQYVVTDGYLRRTGTVTITVTPVNDTPLARDDYYSISGTNLVVNAAGGVLANDTDVEGTALTASVVTQPAHGSLSLNANGSFTYTRNVGWTGTDSFVYRASDGPTNAIARVKIGNAPPIAANDNYALPGSSLTINAASGVLVNDTDPDGDTNFTALLATPPSFGTLQLNANGSFTYNRATNYSGNDSFTYYASDGFDLSQPARVKLGNAAPVAVTNSYNTFSGTALIVPVAQGLLANDSDADGDTLAALLVSPPTNGVLTLSSNGSFTYTANGNFSGIDSFTYRATDGLLNSSPVAVTFTVNGRLQVVAVSPANNAINVATNSTVEITFNVAPSLPTVTSNRVLIYGSLSGYHSSAPSISSNKLILSLTVPFRVGESVRVALQPGIRGTGLFELETPYAWNFSVGSPRGGLNFTEITPSPTNHTNVRVALGDVNGDGRLDAMTVSADFNAPGVLYLNNGGGSFTERLVGGGFYRQIALGDLDRDGDIDAFVIGTERERWLNDGAGNFTITQMPFVNPLITHMALADLDRDGDLDVFLAAVDYSIPEGQGIVWSLLNDGSGNFTESAQTFTINSVTSGALGDIDNDGDLDAYLVGLDGDLVLFNNGSGVFTVGTQTIDTSFNQDVALNDLDGDGDVDAFVVTGDGNRAGRIYYNDGSGRFLPSGLSPQPRRLSSSLALGDINGDGLLDGIESVALGLPGPVPGTNSVWVNAGTAFTNRTFAVTAGDSQHVVLGDLDNDGDLDAFFANGQGTPAVNRIWINQSAPQARNDFYAANGSNPVVVSAPGVLANDGIGDGGPIRAILETLPAKGSVTLNTNGSFTYTPGGSFAGADVFTYYATDGSQTSRIARVKIGNAVPSATNDGVYVAIAGTPLSVTATGGVLANDGDPEGDTLTAILNASPIHGSLQLKPNGSFVYTATNGYVGADSFTYRANDGVSNSGLASVTFDVRSQLILLERTPAPNELRARTDANVVLRFNVAINPASISNNIVISGSSHGPIAFTSTLSSNVLTLNPVADFFVGEQITVLLTGGLEGSSSQRLAKPLLWQFNVEAPFGRGNFTDSGSPLVNTNCSTARVMFADFNRDGYLDVLCQNNRIGPFTNRFGGSNSVWFGTAQGTLVDSGQRFLGTNLPTGYASTTMGDTDGDGDIDLVCRVIGGRFDFWTNNGAGFFGLANTISNSVWDGAAELADLDADKDLDLFILGPSDVSILTNNGTGQFTNTGQVLQPGTSLQFVALGDLDGDGDIDAIVQPFFAAARILVNNGAAVFSDTGQALGLGGQRVCLGDFDGDGDLDFIESRSPSLLFLNNGQGNFTQSSQVFDSFTTQEIKPADLDGDGDLDLVIQASEFLNGTNANRTKIWYNDGSGNFTPTALAFGTVQMASFGVADINRDGALDVLVNRSTFVDPLPVERWYNSIAMGLIEGGTLQTINDTETTSPFSDIVLRSPPSLNLSLQVRLDNIAKGSFTPASLAASGFTGPVGNTYSRTAGTAATAQAALRQLVFAPAQNRKPVGQFELTAFTVEGTDGTTSRTNNATVVKSISVNTSPIANNDGGAGFGTTESATFTTANVLTNDLDADPQDVLSIQTVNTAGLPGTLNNLGNGTFQYIPGNNFVSLPLGVTTYKTFQYTVSDASGALATATVTLTITGQNSAPVAVNDTISIGEKAGTVIITSQMLLNDYDLDAGEQQSLIVSAINTNGTAGIVSLLAGDAVSYNRNNAFGNLAPGATTNTTFGYTLRDVHNATSTATVTLTIVGTNDAPVAQDDVITLTEIAAPTNVTAKLLVNDSDPDPGQTASLAVSGIDTANTIGSVVFTNQSVIYSPNGQFSYLTNGQSATDSFTYFITDTNGATASAIMTVTILGTNSPPVAVPDDIVLQENAGPTNVTALLLANDSDADTNQTTSLVVNGIALTNTTGAVTFSSGVVTYTPSTNLNLVAGQVTNDTFLYIVRDPQGLTATNLVTLTIIGVNDAPVAAPNAFQVNEDSPATNITTLLLANDTDPNPGDAASLVIDGVFTNGTVGAITLTNGSLYYTPSGFFLPPGVTNTDSFLYSVRDRFGSNSIAAVSVTVVGVLSRPAIIITNIVVQTNGHVRLRHNGGDEGYTVQFSQNLNNWQTLGPSTMIAPGLFEYVDTTAPPFGRRNYRILIGAPPIVISSIAVTNGQVRLRHNGTNGTYTVQVSTNLTQWQVLGASTLISPGLFEYVDTTPASGRRFYRIRLP